MRPRWFAFLATCLAWPLAALAQGGPPMLTDDPDTPGAGRWEINIAYSLERTADETLQGLPRLDLNYGVGERVQLKYETGWLVRQDDETGTRSGLDNSLLGVKWRFLDAGDHGLKASIYPQREIGSPSGTLPRGVAEPAPNLALPVEVSMPLGNLTLVGEIGYTVTHSGPDEWFYGLLGADRVSERLELLAELHGSVQAAQAGTSDVVFNVGLRRALSERFTLLFSAGTGLSNGEDRTRFVSYLGVQLHY